MKSIFYSTTALAAVSLLAFSAGDASAQAKRLKLAISGDMSSYMGVQDNDDLPGAVGVATDLDSFNQWNESEVHFRGATKLDNGLSISVRIELETDASTANAGAGPIDESYLSLSGGFGNLRLGTTKAASFSLKHRAPVTGAITHDSPSTRRHVVARGTALALNATHIGGGDVMRIVYFTPRFNGFGIGASYAHNTVNADGITDDNVSGASPSVADIALTFERKLGDVDVRADIATFRLSGNAAGQGAVATPPDSTSIRGGINLGMAGWTIGAGYLDRSTESGVGFTSTGERTVWDIGAMYRTGPWAVSLSYVHGETPDTIALAGDSEQDIVMLGGTYAMGPGISLGATIFQGETSDELNTAATQNKGLAAVGRIKVSF